MHLGEDSLGTQGGDMVFAGSQQNYWVWPAPAPTLYFVNPCSLRHSNASCVDSRNKSMPYMMCQIADTGVFDLGSQVHRLQFSLCSPPPAE